jgi:hypothetical protein
MQISSGSSHTNFWLLYTLRLLFCLTFRCFLWFFHACGRSRTFSFCSRVETREVFRTIVEYLFYRWLLSFLKSWIVTWSLRLFVHWSLMGSMVLMVDVLRWLVLWSSLISVYTGFSKAFDIENHGLLLGTLISRFLFDWSYYEKSKT